MRRRKHRPAETDLFQPVSDFLTRNGYSVRSEVMNCDVTAVKDDELVVIELKNVFGLPVVLQAVKRQRITDSVYVAVPKLRESVYSRKWRDIKLLLRRLEIGLILVSVNPRNPHVEILFHPLPFDRKQQSSKKRAVLREIAGRSGDFNTGGSTRTKLVTAYRENAIQIACCLERFGPLAPQQLRRLGTSANTRSILYNDFYGWFERIDRGVYALRAKAGQDLASFPAIVERYRTAIATLPAPQIAAKTAGD